MNSLEQKWNDGLVSVIMPAYYSEGTISAAIESVIMQTYTNWELLVYDDCSGDRTLDIAENYSVNDSRIMVVKGNLNTGVASARNKALEKAKGRYISFLDSDDRWKIDKLEKQMEFIKQSGCAMTYSSYELMESNGNTTGKVIECLYKEADYRSLLKNNYIGTLTVVIDRFHISDICFSSSRHEDYLLWLEFVKKGYKLLGMDESLAYYRVSPKSLSGNKVKAAIWRWRVYRRNEKLGLVKSLYYMFMYTTNSIAKRI
ncbi:MAG: glycosyltransferase family 2 protein [Clostridia bacterium]|nr:glycosyltransferase family 2 protein [Clostridia bacterium]